jgi:hypothetical protein
MCICRLENVSMIRSREAQPEVMLRSTVTVHDGCPFIMTSEECETWQGY